MPVRFFPPGTPLPDNSPFKGSSVIVGCFKAPKVEQTEQAVAQPAHVPGTELEDEKKPLWAARWWNTQTAILWAKSSLYNCWMTGICHDKNLINRVGCALQPC